ncbi:M23 family metallopeptidase [Paraburkholderia sp. BL10I2N1]|uniref:M23 family metallopeptidase n=1 Tax=Paraburkholderia sp. BL10I2N1 TaxID=1938796 RepID=UPI00105EC9C8|nr:M23 family metallopeptidase [Paraburkholderia sp. BL10I2N1]TDN64064.1 hypothetical protein B0G77_7767 [Paraburkholderia sp. BL10I2N1]
MIISPPFLPESGLTATDGSKPDPMMDAVDKFELAHGIYPIAFDRRWHCGVHLAPHDHGPVYAIADGEVVAYRVCQHAIDSGNGNAGFVLLRHSTETGDGRKLTFYSLYMHLLPLAEYQPFGHDGRRLPEFLRKPTGQVAQGAVEPAVAGGDNTVRRKDVIGFLGRYDSVTYTHFEIFTTPADFDAYFGHTQLGNAAPDTPTGSDCWGHTYYTIPAGQQFYALPPGTDAHNKLHGIKFETRQAGTNTPPLVVETYFSKGAKYTNVWSVEADGSRTQLTESPVCEADYEYDLYHRATALYGTCPSDGYEMLRFGRILSTPATLAGAACATWVQVTYAAGKQGYININNAAIKKLSDADFPSFMGLQKLSDGNTPFSSDGLCDIDALKKLVKDAADSAQPTVSTQTTEVQKADELSGYVRSHDGVRHALRGFICNAPSEWDGTNNQTRYAKLLDEGGFYYGNEQGYNKFINYLKEIQFCDTTGLPAGQKLWFFHPLAFIRHFRKCGWLSKDEFKQIYSDRRYSRNQRPSPDQLRNTYLRPLNLAVRKFGLTSPVRLAHYLGQGAVESAWLASMQETSMLGHLESDGFHGTVINPASEVAESTLGHWYGQIPTEDDAWFRSVKFNRHGVRITGSYDWQNGNCDREDSQKFRGRGFKQLTGRSNYADYWTFKGWILSTSFTASWWTDPAYIAHNRSGMTKKPAMIDAPQRVALPENSLDSGGFYLRFERPKVTRRIDMDSSQPAISDSDKQKERQISRDVTYAINGGYIDWERRLDFTRSAKEIIS